MAQSLVCFCGSNLFSDGNVWQCPAKGTVTAFDKEKIHQGVVVVDKRMNTLENIRRRNVNSTRDTQSGTNNRVRQRTHMATKA